MASKIKPDFSPVSILREKYRGNRSIRGAGMRGRPVKTGVRRAGKKTKLRKKLPKDASLIVKGASVLTRDIPGSTLTGYNYGK